MKFPHPLPGLLCLLAPLLAFLTSALHAAGTIDELRIETSSAGFEVVWSTTPGTYYLLQESAELGNWTSVAGYPAQATGTEMRHAIAAPAAARFFSAREVNVAQSVSWSVGNASSSVDGVPNSGPITFTWTFNRPVQHGVYLDGTPWVLAEEGLQLVAVSPSEQVIASLPDYEGALIPNGVVDATCINLDEGLLQIDRRMGDTNGSGQPWNLGAGRWDGQPASLAAGDCIVTGRGRRDNRSNRRHMIFSAIGVCNIVKRDMTGHYRPPLRMPASQRADMMTPTEVDVATLPALTLDQPRDWAGAPVNLQLANAPGGGDADNLLNGPIANCGLLSYIWYEPGNGMLNHNVSGTDAGGYQRDVTDRFAICLWTAFDRSVNTAKRQRSLNKFIQVGLDYYYMHCLGYPIWNGGGGHCDGLEGAITLTAALLGDVEMTEAVKYQRFPGEAVGMPGTVTDMLGGTQGAYARTEGCYLVQAADWQSGDFKRRSIGTGAATLDDAYIQIDMARADMVLNTENVPYTAITTVGSESAIEVSSSFAWPMYTVNKATEARRSYRYIAGAAIRLQGDPKIRKVTAFKASTSTNWTESTWDGAGGSGGVLVIYPALTPSEIQQIGSTGTLSTGVTTRLEAPSIELWESWPADSLGRVTNSFFASPNQDYLGIKLAGSFHWLPFYHVLPDPSAPGKMLYEESPSYHQLKRFIQMQRDYGSLFWGNFVGDSNVPKSSTIQAFIRHYILDGQMPSTYCKLYDAGDSMWNE